MKRLHIALALLALATTVSAARSDLTTTYTATGTVGVEVAAYATSAAPGPGTLSLTTIPAGSTILQAYLYANNYFATPDTSATFAGTPLGPSAPYATDASFSAYRFDVTGLVTGNGDYAADYSGPDNTYGLALVVAFSHPSLPLSQIFINDGSIDMFQPSVESTDFGGVAAAGPGTLWLHTLADNELGETDEEILFNGGLVGGPIDANLGGFASLFKLGVSTVVGTNTATIDDPADRFGWDLAVLQAPAVPEPGTVTLLGISAAGLGFVAWRRRR